MLILYICVSDGTRVLILALRVTSLNIYLRSCTFYEADTFIFSRMSYVEPSCKILSRYEAYIRSLVSRVCGLTKIDACE